MDSEFFSTSSTFRLCFEGGFATKGVLEEGGWMRFSSIEGLFRWDWIFFNIYFNRDYSKKSFV